MAGKLFNYSSADVELEIVVFLGGKLEQRIKRKSFRPFQKKKNLLRDLFRSCHSTSFSELEENF